MTSFGLAKKRSGDFIRCNPNCTTEWQLIASVSRRRFTSDYQRLSLGPRGQLNRELARPETPTGHQTFPSDLEYPAIKTTCGSWSSESVLVLARPEKAPKTADVNRAVVRWPFAPPNRAEARSRHKTSIPLRQSRGDTVSNADRTMLTVVNWNLESATLKSARTP